MKQPRLGVRLRIAVLGLALLLTALVVAACASATPKEQGDAPPAPAAVQPTAQAAPATDGLNRPTAPVKAGPVAPTTAAAKPGKASEVPMGVDADGNFYRGDPKAPVKLTEYSDFQ